MTFVKNAAPWNKGKPMSDEYKANWYNSYMSKPRSPSEETRKKMSLKNKGRKLAPRTAEHSKKLSESCRGRVTWNKGVETGTNPEHSKRMKGHIPWNKGMRASDSPELMEALRKAHIAATGRPAWNRGLKGFRGGEKSHLWRGGIYAKNLEARNSFEYRQWRMSVFRRDNFTCIFCGKKGGELHADHIKPFSKCIELRFEIGNGRTLCPPCHKETDTYGEKAKTWKEIAYV